MEYPQDYTVRNFNDLMVEKPEGSSLHDWQDAFSDQKMPIDLEIGCGVGWHPIRYALANPGRNLIAIEHTRAKFESFHQRLLRNREMRPESLKNILAVHADAVRWITHALKPETIDRCFILYPNPEPKAQNKRWIRMPFMHRLLEVMKPQGELTIATNEHAYRDEVLDWAVKKWRLEILDSRSFTKQDMPPDYPRTHFEKKYMERGQTCFDIRMKRP